MLKKFLISIFPLVMLFSSTAFAARTLTCPMTQAEATANGWAVPPYFGTPTEPFTYKSAVIMRLGSMSHYTYFAICTYAGGQITRPLAYMQTSNAIVQPATPYNWSKTTYPMSCKQVSPNDCQFIFND